ncbi:MAG: molecular chaperone HtpG [Rhodospirillales bacterium]|nr:molecular chaperone HtpG [Rhodospirillales bacterium]
MSADAETAIDPGASAGAETHAFGAEVGRLLDLVVHALYSEREIFLRELVANAADATDRRRFAALTDPALALPEGAGVRIEADRAGRSLTIADQGIGMTREELIANLGTIARSGTRAFGEALAEAKPEDRPSLIGQFGVGFYSAFMVAERVEVTSRKAGSAEAWCWTSSGAGEFTIAPATRETIGTEIVLRLKPDAEEYLEPVRLETIVRKWADHISLPIAIVRDGKEVQANTGTAIWRRAKSDITEAEREEFYRHLGHFLDQPWASLHWRAEGALEYYAMLFIPGARPFEAVEGERQSKLRLHVRRMFITDQADLLPPWLRFVDGVVDTEDLPLNVSREMLQATPVLGRIRGALIKRVLGELKSRAEAEDKAGYAKFWENFGAILKEGVWEDHAHRGEIAPLLRFRSSAREGWVGFDDYIAAMGEGQDTIYYLAGDNAAALAGSAQLEGFRAKGIEVLLLGDSIDAFWPERLDTYRDKKIVSITKADAKAEEGLPDLAAFCAVLRAALGDAVSAVRTTARLTDSAVVLAAGESGPDLQMQRLLRRAGRMSMAAAPILEINPHHALIAALAALPPEDAALGEAASILFDLAAVQEGDAPRDAAAFARRVAALMARGFAKDPE